MAGNADTSNGRWSSALISVPIDHVGQHDKRMRHINLLTQRMSSRLTVLKDAALLDRNNRDEICEEMKAYIYAYYKFGADIRHVSPQDKKRGGIFQVEIATLEWEL